MSETKSNALVTQPSDAITPMRMLEIAVSQNADLDKLQKLMELQERWEANEAKKAFTEAMAAFKANPPTIYKDKENKQYGSRYTSLSGLVNAVNGGLSQHGLSASWTINQSDKITVTCVLTHRLGHKDSVSMSGPPDDSGKKNPLQQIKSTTTYLKISTLEAVCGLASTEANEDDDGNGEERDRMDENQLCDYIAAIDAADSKGEVAKVYLKAIEAASSLKDQDAMDRLNSVKDERLAALANP